MATTAPTRRVNRGRGHSYYLDGEKVPGVTAILRDGYPRTLHLAASREAADYLVNNWADLRTLEPAEVGRRVEAAASEKWSAAAARGTAIHTYAARLLAGDTVEPPDDVRDAVDACLRFLEDWDVRELAVEVTVVNRAWRYMGTADLLARLGDDDAVWLFDWKTGAGDVWPDVALQVSAYAHAETMLVDGPGDGTSEITLPRVAHAAAVRLHADGYEVVPLDISNSTFFYFLYVQQVARFRNRDRTELVGAPLELDAPR